MPFVDSVFKYGSIAFVGMDKNCGKTETMNYFLQGATSYNKNIAVTSIGIDGEQKDQVTATAKPEITLYEGDMFLTCEAFYKSRRLVSEILDISDHSTALGRLVTARVLQTGKVMLAGPADTYNLRKDIAKLKRFGAELVVVDGALSRLSIASPTVTDALILSTGAVVAPTIDGIVKKTAYQVELIRIPEINTPFVGDMNNAERGIYCLTEQGLVDSGVDSVFTIGNNIDRLFANGYTIFFSGALNDTVVESFTIQPFVDKIEIVVRDFTKIFVTDKVLNNFLKRGGRIKVVSSSKLLAVSVNPVSVKGYSVSSEDLCDALSQRISQDVYDVRRLQK